MYTLATLHDLRQYLGLAAVDTTEDPRLVRALQAASAALERETGRRFSPQHETLLHHPAAVDTLILRDDLLVLTSVTDASGIIPAEDIHLLPERPPHSVLRLGNGRRFMTDPSLGTGVAISGIWGWHDAWASAWLLSGDEVRNTSLSATSTQIQVFDADGADAERQSPRFSVGSLLKIENEYLRVLEVDSASNFLYAARGAGGTLPAAHSQGSTILVYQPPRDIRMIVTVWAAALYRAADNAQPAEGLRGAVAHLRRDRVA